MEGFITIILLLSYIGITIYGWELREQLKKTEYWEKLPSGTAVFGYLLPIILFILLSKEHVGAGRILLCILFIIAFVCCIIGVNNNLKEKPLSGCSAVLPDDIRKKVVVFNALTPLLTIFIVAFIMLMLNMIFGISDDIKRQRKNKK